MAVNILIIILLQYEGIDCTTSEYKAIIYVLKQFGMYNKTKAQYLGVYRCRKSKEEHKGPRK